MGMLFEIVPSANKKDCRALGIARQRQVVGFGIADIFQEETGGWPTLGARKGSVNEIVIFPAGSRSAVSIPCEENNRYRDGLITYLEVATAESTALNIEFSATQLRGQQLVATVTLVKALGGGWQETREP